MIEVYLVPTANGQKVAILLEELGLPYRAHVVVRAPGDVPSPDYLRLNPMGKYPTLVDRAEEQEPIVVFETLAIALYLTERTGALVPEDRTTRAAAHTWAALAASDLTPAMATQYFLTLRATSDVAEAEAWVVGEVHRFLKAIDERLADARYLAGETYTYADVLTFPLIATSVQRLDGGLDRYANIRRWFDEVAARPAVQKGMRAAGA